MNSSKVKKVKYGSCASLLGRVTLPSKGLGHGGRSAEGTRLACRFSGFELNFPALRPSYIFLFLLVLLYCTIEKPGAWAWDLRGFSGWAEAVRINKSAQKERLGFQYEFSTSIFYSTLVHTWKKQLYRGSPTYIHPTLCNGDCRQASKYGAFSTRPLTSWSDFKLVFHVLP